jgi:glycosyltransferase involved in cell wall biosynthesis
MQLGYLVSRFPHPSETFIVRELDAVTAAGEVELELMSLFRATDTTVHPRARPWAEQLRRPGLRSALGGVGYWLRRRPLRLLASAAIVAVGHARRPSRLVRALATLPLAAAHARRIHGSGIEHLHAHYATYPALAAWLIERLTAVPYSFTAHAHDLYVDQSMLARKLRDARFAVTISEFNRRFLEDHAGGGQAPIHVVHCGVDPSELAYRPRSVPREGAVKALCVASLQEYKGHAVLLSALAADGEVSRVSLDVVGGGPLRDELERRARELGLADRIRFHGSLPEPRVLELMAEADLLVLPSVIARDGQMEGLPLVLVEALASGLPVVATDLSGVPELIDDGATGLLARPGDPAALRAALERLLSGGFAPDQDRGRELVERDFDVRRSAERLLSLFSG